MDNNAEKEYESWPERLFVLKNNKFVYVGGFGPCLQFYYLNIFFLCYFLMAKIKKLIDYYFVDELEYFLEN